jgi:hypothetical protein
LSRLSVLMSKKLSYKFGGSTVCAS